MEWVVPETPIHEWKDGISPNNGLVLVPYGGTKKDIRAHFASRENATAAYRPQLVITCTE